MKDTQMKTASTIIKIDHDQIRKLFDQYNSTQDPKEKESLVQSIVQKLYWHARFEQEVFFPGIKNALDDEASFENALAETEAIKLLIDKLQRLFADFDKKQYTESLDQLKTLVLKHMDNEENLLPTLKGSELDTTMGQQFAANNPEHTLP
ncbi:MAG: hemerythrin domain-containing protein [Candidatus Obscuribacterales bacterium]|nr:hemerythrin domain-containing protein [Candidatus Obscuribacterales bacterium]